MFTYISGKITGTKDFYQRFNAAEEKLLRQGYTPINPVKNVPKGMSWEYYMRQDIIKLLQCDTIYMLKGWRSSRGARLELLIAKKLKFKVIYEN